MNTNYLFDINSNFHGLFDFQTDDLIHARLRHRWRHITHYTPISPPFFGKRG